MLSHRYRQLYLPDDEHRHLQPPRVPTPFQTTRTCNKLPDVYM
jgi:hypothetical protein